MSLRRNSSGSFYIPVTLFASFSGHGDGGVWRDGVEVMLVIEVIFYSSGSALLLIVPGSWVVCFSAGLRSNSHMAKHNPGAKDPGESAPPRMRMILESYLLI